MAAERLVTVTLARAWDAGEQAKETGTIEFAVALDAFGQPDMQAWLDDPQPWPVAWLRPGQPPQSGDVACDEEGWQLRVFVDGAADADLPTHRISHMPAALRPGEVLNLRAPDGDDGAWRVVGVTPRGG